MTIIEFRSVSKLYKLGQISSGYFLKDIQTTIAKWRNKEDPNSIVNFHNKNYQCLFHSIFIKLLILRLIIITAEREKFIVNFGRAFSKTFSLLLFHHRFIIVEDVGNGG